MALLRNVDIMDGEKFTLGWSTFQNHLLDTNNHLFQQKSITNVTLVLGAFMTFQIWISILGDRTRDMIRLLFIILPNAHLGVVGVPVVGR